MPWTTNKPRTMLFPAAGWNAGQAHPRQCFLGTTIRTNHACWWSSELTATFQGRDRGTLEHKHLTGSDGPKTLVCAQEEAVNKSVTLACRPINQWVPHLWQCVALFVPSREKRQTRGKEKQQRLLGARGNSGSNSQKRFRGFDSLKGKSGFKERCKPPRNREDTSELSDWNAQIWWQET